MSVEAIIRTDKLAGASVMHSHGDSWEFILATEGTGNIVATGFGDLPFKTGTMTVIPPGVMHYNISDAPYKQFALRISTQSAIFDAPTTLEDKDGSLLAILTVIFNVFYDTAPQRTNLLGTLEDALLSLLSMSIERARRRNPEVERALSIINISYTRADFRIGEALGSVAYSEAHLRKLFLAEVGMTMSKYLNLLRLQHAGRMLKGGGCSILTAAELSGFSDFRYFSRLFKEKHGMTPSEWRNKSR